jgi:delta-aminolevulinic acid dehydratase/porphobilinogen synthase
MQASMNNPEILLRRMRRVEHMREFIAEQHVTRHDLTFPSFFTCNQRESSCYQHLLSFR